MKLNPALVLAPALAALAVSTAAAGQPASDPSLVERGRYLTTAGDCVGCHTAANGASFAGGLALTTPMGTLVSANITPDAQTGIGSWDATQFYRALHKGRGDGGAHLYPAMPYNYFTKVTREDSDAIFAYLRTVPAVSNAPRRDQLPFPLNIRALMGLWNFLFFREGTFTPNSAKSADWNRGAYLVEGLGHCGGCHTPMNLLGAPKTDAYLQGGAIEDWFAPDLTANPRQGLGGWSHDDIILFLKTGRNAHAAVTGPMGEVISKSTGEMSDADLSAIATYLADIAPSMNPAVAAPPARAMSEGQTIYAANCAGCHQAEGQGRAGLFPPLKGHAGLQQTDPTTTIRVILTGAQGAAGGSAMPAFAARLTDDQIAAVATYARNSWGNSAAQVQMADVLKLRRKVVPAPAPTPDQTGAPIG